MLTLPHSWSRTFTGKQSNRYERKLAFSSSKQCLIKKSSIILCLLQNMFYISQPRKKGNNLGFRPIAHPSTHPPKWTFVYSITSRASPSLCLYILDILSPRILSCPVYSLFSPISLISSLPLSLTVSFFYCCGISPSLSFGPTGHIRLTIASVCQHRKPTTFGTVIEGHSSHVFMTASDICTCFFLFCFEVFKASFRGRRERQQGCPDELHQPLNNGAPSTRKS